MEILNIVAKFWKDLIFTTDIFPEILIKFRYRNTKCYPIRINVNKQILTSSNQNDCK